MTWSLVRTVVGIIGNVVSFCLFCSPSPTIYRIYKNKSVEEFQPYPYIGAVMNCIFWIFYGIVTPNSILVITINGVGLFLELCYIGFFLYFSKPLRRKILLLLLAEVLAAALVACITLLAFHSQTKRSIFVGVFSVIFGMFLYGAPLTIMAKVVKTKSVEYMPFWVSFSNLCNGIVWTFYALIKVPPTNKIDIFILLANGIGAFLAAGQIVLYASYYGSTPKKSKTTNEPKGSKPEVQLSQV